MAAQYRCNACGFTSPANTIGAAIMDQHLKDEHRELIR